MPRSFLQAALRCVSVVVLALAPVLAVHAAGTAVNYAYDVLGRLTKVTYADGTVTYYAYDPAGNRTASGKPPTSGLTLSGCGASAPAQYGSTAAFSCTVGNTGAAAASNIRYQPNIASMVLSSAPSSCAANTPNCGLVTLLTPSTPGTYANTLVATADDGTSTSAPYSLTVYTAAVLSLSSCASITPSTLPATSSMTCVVGNSGQSTVSVTYSLSVAGATISGGPTSCAGNTANCGSVKVTAPATAGTYAASLFAVPSAGSSASAPFTLVNNGATVAAFTVVSSTGPVTTFRNPNAFAVTPSDSGMNVPEGFGFASVSSNTCTSSVAAGGTCTINILAGNPDCKLDNYHYQAYVTDAGGTASGTLIYKTTNVTVCR